MIWAISYLIGLIITAGMVLGTAASIKKKHDPVTIFIVLIIASVFWPVFWIAGFTIIYLRNHLIS